MLDQVAGEKMGDAPDRLRFRASAQWGELQGVLKRKLERLIRDDFGGTNPLVKPFGGEPREIWRQELKFGFGDQPPVTLDLDGERLRVRGAIDRIDRQGERAILVDYKSGSTHDSRQRNRGRAELPNADLSAGGAAVDRARGRGRGVLAFVQRRG